MILITFAALAIPLTLVGLGVREYTRKSRLSTVAPEVPGLRASLEQSADKALQVPAELSDNRSIFTMTTPSVSKIRSAMEKAVARLNGVVVSAYPGGQGGERLLIQIPSIHAETFEAEALRGFMKSQTGHATDNARLYELILTPP